MRNCIFFWSRRVCRNPWIWTLSPMWLRKSPMNVRCMVFFSWAWNC